MAINIEWQVKPPLKNEEKAQMFPRIIDSEMVNEQQLSKLIASHGSLSKGNAKAALNDLSEVMADLLSEGKTVCIPSLGSFKLSVGTDSEIYPDTDRRMQSIVVRGVNFQPSQEFMAAIGKPSFLWKSKTGVAIAPTTDQLIPQFITYFKTHDSITREEFERTFGLKRTTAYMRLKEMEKKGVIKAIGNGRERKYILQGQCTCLPDNLEPVLSQDNERDETSIHIKEIE